MEDEIVGKKNYQDNLIKKKEYKDQFPINQMLNDEI